MGAGLLRTEDGPTLPLMRLLRSTAILIVLTYPAVAQNPSPSPGQAAPASEPSKPAAPSPAALSAGMEAALRKAGFTDLRIMPNSVFVRGKDKAGNPVAMVLNPGSMTEMVTLDPHSGSAAGGNGAPALTGSATFATVLPGERLVSKIIGTAVTDMAGHALGVIQDVAVDHGGVQAYIVHVAGLLGIGDRYAAVTPTAITLVFDKGKDRFAATMDATPDQMNAAPPFQYGDVDEATK